MAAYRHYKNIRGIFNLVVVKEGHQTAKFNTHVIMYTKDKPQYAYKHKAQTMPYADMRTMIFLWYAYEEYDFRQSTVTLEKVLL